MTNSHHRHQSLSNEENIGLLQIDDDIAPASPRTLPTNSRPRSIVVSSILSIIQFFQSLLQRASILRLLWFCVPSFLQGRHAHGQNGPTRVSPTAYLDGMRGLAAVAVFFFHWSLPSFDSNESWGRLQSRYNFLKLPIVRLAYSGDVGVSLFFLISGYALSYRALQLIRKGNFHDFATAVSSTAFRRLFRLYLPTVVSTFIVCCLLQLGVYDWSKPIYTSKVLMPVFQEAHPQRQRDVWSQLKHWQLFLFRMIHMFGWDRDFPAAPTYDSHLWTIPIEYRCSIYLFVILVGTARLKTVWRFMTLSFITFISFRHSRWDLIMFIFGMALAEWDQIRGAHVRPSGLTEKQQNPKHQHIKTAIWALVSIVALYLMSYPGYAEETPGFVWLSTWVPKWWKERRFRIWQCTGATIFAIAVSYSPHWQRFYNSAIVQYFGKISYALYLVHGPILHTVGCFWMKFAWDITGLEGNWYIAGFVLSGVFIIPTVVWAADIFWRAVDIPSVKLAKWIENKVIVKWD